MELDGELSDQDDDYVVVHREGEGSLEEQNLHKKNPSIHLPQLADV